VEFVDDGYSGARLDRPALDRLRDTAEAGVLDGVICLCGIGSRAHTPTSLDRSLTAAPRAGRGAGTSA